MCLFICSQHFPSPPFFFLQSSNVQVCISTIMKHLPYCSRLERFLSLQHVFHYSDLYFSFPLSIAQIIKMKFFGVFIENHIQPLCNMILEEKGAQALRSTLETSPIFGVRDVWLEHSALHSALISWFLGFLEYLSGWTEPSSSPKPHVRDWYCYAEILPLASYIGGILK